MSVQHITDRLRQQNLTGNSHDCATFHEKIRHHSEPGRISKHSECRKLYRLPACDGTSELCCDSGGLHACLETPPLSISGTAMCNSPKVAAMPPDPPSKRHCRSLSIPGDQTCPSDHRKLHRPVALRPHHNNNKLKSRQSPLVFSKPTSPSAFNSMSPITTSVTTSDYFSTPPDSPVPRPASVSSGYYDGSLNSLSAPWLESCRSASTLGPVVLSKSRSLSFEGRISDDSSAVSVTKVCVGWTPSSPQRLNILRCHSQPCVLHERERKCGLKRRRGEDRPSLNFDKMNEKLRGRAIPQSYKSVRSLASAFADPSHVLTSIASSPLDSNIPVDLSPPQSTDQASENQVAKEELCEHNVAERSDSGCYLLDDDPPHIVGTPSSSWDQKGNQSTDFITDSDLQFPLDNSVEIDLDLIEND